MSQSKESHVTIDATKFDPKAIPKETNAFNQSLMDIMAGAPRWYEVCDPSQSESSTMEPTP